MSEEIKLTDGDFYLDATISLKPFLEFVEIVENFDEVVTLQITQDGFEIEGVDPAHVMGVVSRIKKEGFMRYKHDLEEPFQRELAINLTQLKKALEIEKNRDKRIVTIRLQVGEDVLVISDYLNQQVKIPRSNIEPSNASMPTLNLKAQLNINAERIRTSVQLDKLTGDFTYLIVDNEGFYAGIEDGDFDPVSYLHVDKEELDHFKYEGEGCIKSQFANDYLGNIFRLAKNDTVTINMGHNYPLVVAGDRYNYLEYELFLAPRIEEVEV